jgi:hypothetical protein
MREKILIIGLPRSGTTVLQKTLSLALDLELYNEPYNTQANTLEDPYKWTSEISSGIIKLISFNLQHINFKKLLTEGNFDSFIVTNRNNLVDCCISLYYATLKNKFHYSPTDTVTLDTFTVPLCHVHMWLRGYRLYKHAVDYLDKNSIPYTVFDYEQYLDDIPQIINNVELKSSALDTDNIHYVSAKIPYNKLCLNYEEIKDLLNEQNIAL